MTIYEAILRASGVFDTRLTAERQERCRPPHLRYICTDAEGLDQITILRYRLGDLYGDERAGFEKHLRECLGCQKYLAELEPGWERFRAFLEELAVLEACCQPHYPDVPVQLLRERWAELEAEATYRESSGDDPDA